MRDIRAFVREQLSPLRLGPGRERKIVEELAAQLEESYDALRADGRSDEEAWTEVQRQVPDWRTLADELFDAEPALTRLTHPERGHLAGRLLRGLMPEGRSSLRLLLKDRAFTAATLLTLAVCLGANAAIFTVVYSVLLRPLAVPAADRLVAMGDVYPATPDSILSNAAPSYFDRLEAVTALDEQAMFAPWFDTMVIEGTAEEVRGVRTTPSLFRLLQTPPAMGRPFTDADAEPGAGQKIILSDGLWRRLYGGDPAAIGRELRLGWTGLPYTIVGVMPPGFSFFDHGDDGHARGPGDAVQFWIPLVFTEAQRTIAARTRYGFYHVGRMRPGATIELVQAQLDALNAANFERFPELRLAELGMRTVVTPLQHALTRGVRRILYLLWGGAALLLVIGALNIANLSLARSRVRARELATRLALGAGRFRLIRLLLLEGVVLAGAGGLAGIAVGAWILDMLIASGWADIPNAAAVGMDGTVVAFTMALALSVGVLMGLVPALTAGALNLHQVLAEGSRLGTAGRATHLFRRGLVVAQVALSVVLLVGAALLVTSFRNLLALETGFDAARVTTATVFPPPSRYADQAAVAALSDRILTAVRALPGIEAAGITSNIALSGEPSPATVSAAGRPPHPGDAPLLPSVVSVTPGYFEAMGTPLIRGRAFADSDRADTLPVAIVDERLAALLWPNEDPIGKSLHRGGATQYTVVGLVRDVRFEGLAGTAYSTGTAYFPHTQAPLPGRLRWIAIRTTTDAVPVTRALRMALAAIDPDLPLADIQTMRQRMAGSVVPQTLASALTSAFGLVALLLSTLGIYGVLAYVVVQRTREIGIRVALGSSARDTFRLVFAEGLTLVGGGLLLGLLGALALGRVMEGQMHGVAPTDPFVLGSVALVAGIVALLGCVLPAYRAARVDPARVLGQS